MGVAAGSVPPRSESAQGRIAVAQIGARLHYAIPRMLESAGMLDHLYLDTTAVAGPLRLLHLVPRGFRPGAVQRLLDRVPSGVPTERITAFQLFGIEYVRRVARARDAAARVQTSLWAGEAFCRLVIERMGDAIPGGVYAFAGAGMELLRFARDEGRCAVLDQTIAPHAKAQRIMSEENDRHPEWEGVFDSGEPGRRYSDREREEWQNATLILCGSEFVRRGVAEYGGPAERCVVMPYAADPSFSAARRPRPHGGPLRVLTVGAVGLRKGSPYVQRAAEILAGRAEFRMVGPIEIGEAGRQHLAASVDLVGMVPRSDVLSHYAWADLFLLPSLCEGSAGVIYEALTAGLPVVTTENSGSVVRDGVEGFVVPIRDAEAIAERLTRFAENADLVREMSDRACRRGAEYELGVYEPRFISCLAEHLSRNA